MQAELSGAPPSLPPDAYERFVALCAKVDALFSAIYEEYQEHMQCGAGCAQCCHSRLAVTLVEAVHLRRGLAALAPEVRERLAERAKHGEPTRCALLEDDGRCALYAFRPLICRSHGAPLRRYEMQRASSGEHRASRAGHGKVRLPVVEVCEKNFADTRVLDTIEPGMMFDQTVLSAVLGTIAAAFADEIGAPPDTRIDIASLVANPEDF